MSHRTDVPVEPLRDAFLRSGLSAAEVCRWLEWYRPDGGPDTSRFRRALGLLPNSSHGRSRRARRIGVDRATLIADALSIDPWEVGI
jgi:hypothetical protein